MGVHATELVAVPRALRPDLRVDAPLVDGEVPQSIPEGGAIVFPAYVDALSRTDGHGRPRIEFTAHVTEEVSAHQVQFGLVTTGAQATDSGIPVACKTFGTARDALHEVSGYLTIQALGIPTFQPYGVFPDVNRGGWFAVTAFRPDLASLDGVQWVQGMQPRDEGEAAQLNHNRQLVMKVAQVAALMHVHGVFHPDGQAKNYAVTPGGAVGVIDTEKLRTVPLNDPRVTGYALEDLAKLIASLRAPYREGVEQGIYGMGFFQGLDPRQLRAQVEELIVEPYLDVLGQFAAQYSGDSDRLAHVEVLLAGIVQAFSDETGTGLLPALDQP